MSEIEIIGTDRFGIEEKAYRKLKDEAGSFLYHDRPDAVNWKEIVIQRASDNLKQQKEVTEKIFKVLQSRLDRINKQLADLKG